jgi:predicted secreted Zn-dependent protease
MTMSLTRAVCLACLLVAAGSAGGVARASVREHHRHFATHVRTSAPRHRSLHGRIPGVRAPRHRGPKKMAISTIEHPRRRAALCETVKTSGRPVTHCRGVKT